MDYRKWSDGFSRSTQFRYNRVEGLFIGYRLSLAHKSWRRLSTFTEGGAGIHNEKARWEGGLAYRDDRTLLSAGIFDRTETNDRETVGTAENTFLALLFKWDYQDHFRTKHGFELKGDHRLRRRLYLTGRLAFFAYEHMPVETNWSIFYPDRPFRINPRIREGNAGLFKLSLRYEEKPRGPMFRNSWHMEARFERGFRDFPYNGLEVTVRRSQKLIFGNQAIVIQGRLGSRESTAEQHLFDLGGVSTLRGFEIKEFTGNRVLLFNLDYQFRGDAIGRVPLPFVHLLDLTFFLDTGWLNAVSRVENIASGFGSLELGDFKTSVGLGIALPVDLLRINIARRLDRDRDPWILSIRLKSEF